MSSLILGLVTAAALAQSDTTGASIPLGPGPAADPSIRLAPSVVSPRGAFGFGVGVRAASPSLTELVVDGQEVMPDELVGFTTGVRLHAAWAPVRRLGIGAMLPVRLTGSGSQAGPGVGDLGIRATVAIIEPTTRGSVSLAATPWVRLPTGSSARNLGSGGIRAGASLAAGVPLGPVTARGEAGLDVTPDGLLPGGPGWRAGVGVRVPLGERFAVDVDTVSWSLFESAGRGVGNRTGVALHGRLGQWQASVSPAAAVGVREAGTSSAVGEVVVGWSSQRAEPLPEPDPNVAIRVVDPDGRIVRGAEVFRDGALIGATDAMGIWRGREADAGPGLVVRAPGLVETPIAGELGSRATDVDMDFAPTPLRIRVGNAVGEAVQPTLEMFEVDGSRRVELSGDGLAFRGEALPGLWMLRIESEGYGAQGRLVRVGPRRVSPIEIEAVLLEAAGNGTLAVEVVDAGGKQVEGARVLVDGVPVGTTSTDGSAWIHSLAGETRSVRVQSTDYAESVVDIALGDTEDVEAEAIEVDYVPGTVRVRALGPDGPVNDGILFVQGPVALPPMPLRSDGERLVVLDPGSWTLTLSSAALGLQERAVEIELDSPNPLDVGFVLQPAGTGEGDMTVRVTDRHGVAVDGARVVLDGLDLGTTASGGTVRLQGIEEGPHVVTVSHPAIETAEASLQLDAGVDEHRVIVAWRPGTIRVTATAAGLPADALVLFDGPSSVPPTPLGPRGQRYFTDLESGTWDVTASSAEYGLQSRTLSVTRPNDRLPEALVRFGGLEDGDATLDVRVKDPEGNPAAYASVALDGIPLGRTGSDGRVRLDGLRDGVRQVLACDGLLAPLSTEVSLPATADIELSCDWAVGATTFAVGTAGQAGGSTLFFLSGPDDHPPRRTGDDGTYSLALTPGEWTVVFSSAETGLSEFAFTVPEEPGHQRLELSLDGDQEPSLLVRARTPHGEPIRDAAVFIDGTERARTDTAGRALVRGLTDGAEVQLRVDSPAHESDAGRVVSIDGLRNEKLIELVAQPVALTLTTTDAAGQPVDASIDLLGRERLDTVELKGGRGVVQVPPGDWQVLAQAPGLAAIRMEVEVTGPDEVAITLPEARVKRVGTSFEIQDVQFAPGEAVVDDSFGPVLDELAAMTLADRNILRIEAQGHTDSTGSVAFNTELSHQRAQAVRVELLFRGVPPAMVVARGFGPTQPIEDNDTEEGRAANRRVVLRIIEGLAD